MCSASKKNWRAVVSDGDTVVIPGDVSWAMSLEGAQKDFAFLDSLPGKKILMKGNHDYWWNTARKMENFFKEKGFETLSIVHNSAVSVGNISVCGTRGWFFDAEEDADKKSSSARGGTAPHIDRKRNRARRRAGRVSPLSADNAG